MLHFVQEYGSRALRQVAASLPVRAVAAALLPLALSTSIGNAGEVRPLPGPTVREVVEFTRIIQPHNQDSDLLQTQVSPDGAKAFIVTRRGDVDSDKNLFDTLLLDVSAARLAANEDMPPRKLLTVQSTKDHSYRAPSIQDARWAGNDHIVFLGRIHDATAQVYALDVRSGAVTQLTSEANAIVTFDVARDVRTVVYTALIPNPPMAPGARSVVVGSQSFWSVKFGQNDTESQMRRYRFFVSDGVEGRPARPLGESFLESSSAAPSVSVSPDGRWAIVPRFEPSRQLEWAEQYPLIAEPTYQIGPSAKIDPLKYFSRPAAFVPRRLVVYRVSDLREQAVVDAPDDADTGLGQTRPDRLWQRDDQSVVIAGTHLPTRPGMDPVAARSSHIIEYWPESGRWVEIAALAGRMMAARSLRLKRDTFVVLDDDRRRAFERRDDGAWQELPKEIAASLQDQALPTGWTLRVDQALNQPPEVVAHGPKGRVKQLTSLNPQYSAASWGTMRPYTWKDPAGRRWDGGLMVPSEFALGVRHALVIQTYGFSADRFYLDGSNVVDGFTSGFAGRAFLRENVLVLGMPWKATVDEATGGKAGQAGFNDGVQGAIEALVKAGIVDPERVGIMGWSGSGEQVLNLVTFSRAPLRAAALMDGDANTVFSLAVTYGASDNMLKRKEEFNRGRPFGDSMQTWVSNDPAMHTDCISAAMRIETYGPWVLNNWDIYALLRRQYKPAEMVVIPAGTHALSRPSERMISLQGNVDWFSFWLTGKERRQAFLLKETEATLAGQYANWRQMEELKRADDAKPRCARLASLK